LPALPLDHAEEFPLHHFDAMLLMRMILLAALLLWGLRLLEVKAPLPAASVLDSANACRPEEGHAERSVDIQASKLALITTNFI
jgi:hypothetical protein